MDINAYTLLQLQTRLRNEILDRGNAEKVARDYDVNSAHIHHVFNGNESPTLRAAMDAPKYPPRCRLRIDCTPELRDEFHTRRGNMTGGEYLQYLMENVK
jgi:hypothetical protein